MNNFLIPVEYNCLKIGDTIKIKIEFESGISLHALFD